MRKPAREKPRNRRGGEVGGAHAGIAREVPRMIESQENHDDAANHVDRFNPDAVSWNGLGESRD
jgi:hypothetical protein